MAMGVNRHSLGWVVGRDEHGALVEFVNVVTDGLMPARLQDTTLAKSAGGLGLEPNCSKVARNAGGEWLH